MGMVAYEFYFIRNKDLSKIYDNHTTISTLFYSDHTSKGAIMKIGRRLRNM
jgi:hypothetical protein